jgi:hypothetical protein
VEGVNFSPIGTTSGDTFMYHDGTAGPDSIYFYEVYATTGNGSVLSSYASNVATVNTPGASITINARLDPAFNPEIWQNTEDANDDGVPDYKESGPINGETQLATVTINAPLGADDYGTEDLAWPSAIKLYADNEKRTLLGTLSLDGTTYTLVWNASQAATTRTFYAEDVVSSTSLGDRSFSLSESLSYDADSTPPTTEPAPPNPTTSPSTSKATTEPTFSIVSNRDGTLDTSTAQAKGSNAKEALVGQQIQVWVEAGPAALHVGTPKYTWSIPGEPVLSFSGTPKTSVKVLLPSPVTSVGDKKVTFYWIKGSTTGEALTVSVADAANPTGTSTSSFDVYTPTVKLHGTATTDRPAFHVGEVPGFPGNFLQFGNSPFNKPVAKISPGYSFTGSVTTPQFNDSAGSIAFVQLVQATEKYTPAGKAEVTVSTKGYELDTKFPLHASAVAAANTTPITKADLFRDSPGILVTGRTLVDFHEDFDDYFMYQPSGSASIYVTVAEDLWSCGDSATLPAGKQDNDENWVPTVPGTVPTGSVAAPSSKLPTWVANAADTLNAKPS